MPRSKVPKKRLFREFSPQDKKYILRNYLKNIKTVKRKINKEYDISFSMMEFLLWGYDLQFFTIKYAAKGLGMNENNTANRFIYPLMKREEFLLKVQRICFDIEKLTEEYGADKVISLVVLGCIEDHHDDGIPRMSAIYNYNIEDKRELDCIVDFVDATWDSSPNEKDSYDGLDDLLDGLDIDLE